MSKRRRASILMFKNKYSLKYPVDIVPALTGTGTETKSGVITVVATVSTTNRAYVTISSGTNIGTLVGTQLF